MHSLHEQLFRAVGAQLEQHLDTNAMLAAGAMQGMQEFAGLNINMARATLEQSNFAARQLLLAQDLKQLLALACAQLAPNARRAFDYGYYIVTIATGLQSQLIRFAGERMGDTNLQLALLRAFAGQATVSPLGRPGVKQVEYAAKLPRAAMP